MKFPRTKSFKAAPDTCSIGQMLAHIALGPVFRPIHATASTI
jgi:hypothetical protein